MAQEQSEKDLAPFIERVVSGESLSVAEAEEVFDAFMAGAASQIQMAGLLAALRTRGVQPTEVAGGVRALRKAMVPIASADPGALVDTAGTGGGSTTTFNISTAAALVTAGAGVPVAKHGNRSFTSRCGSADVLEALGVRIDLSPERMGEVLADAGIVFMFAPLLHPAMRHVGPVRRGLGVTTIMNILGPLTNPAGARRQVIGVADPDLLHLVARALAELGHTRALVVHGEPGMDEISPCGATRVVDLSEGRLTEYEVTPEALGVSASGPVGLEGGDPEGNARVIEAVLGGADGAPRAAVLLNAAAAIYVGGAAESLKEGVGIAAAAIDEGRAAEALARLRTSTNA